MTAVTAPETGATSTSLNLRDGRRFGDNAFRIIVLACGLSVLAILILIAWSTTKEAWPIFSDRAAEFFTTSRWAPSADKFGALSFIYGTLLTSALAVLFAVPLSVGIALFVTEVAPRWLRKAIVSVLDLLAVVPSVVFGLWGILVLAEPINDFYTKVSDALSGIPVIGALFEGPTSGRAFFTAGLILGIMIVPIITAVGRDILRGVPRAQVEGTVALGATWWQSAKEMLKYSRSGLFGAIMLGLARAAGETMAVTMVIGNKNQISASLFAPAQTMSSLLASEFAEASDIQRSALMEVALILLLMSLLFNVIARYLVVGKNARTAAAH